MKFSVYTLVFLQLDSKFKVLCCKEEKDLCYVSDCSLLFNCRFSIMAPNVFHIGVEEKVSVTVFDAGKPVTVKVYLQDYPHRRKTFSEVQAVLSSQAVLSTQPGEMNSYVM